MILLTQGQISKHFNRGGVATANFESLILKRVVKKAFLPRQDTFTFGDGCIQLSVKQTVGFHDRDTEK